MPRLRITARLSLLALFIGVAGTDWLSGQTAGWAGPAKSLKPVSTRPVTQARAHSRPAPHMAPRPSSSAVARSRATVTRDAHAEEAPALVPIAMPAAASSYAELRGHLNGRVLLHLTINGQGQVTTAAISESSGDAVLDAHGLSTVRGWRFAVPADHPNGLSGELSMRFDADEAVARSSL
ncbi:energy transducer TonB [Dyella tabacisoli]|uniref:TonB family protein n=1 Tax=Dyella tabacisoli TaxID=2282381 RepID=A0A369UN18_9GAMM|nr:TonB family protein [Dyella tabacisoli]RDD81000.1 TonB family protein [Dyella tabacisoli]